MADTLSEIRDDIANYRELCARFAEPIRYKNGTPDCCGEHAKQLKEKAARSDAQGAYAAGDFGG